MSVSQATFQHSRSMTRERLSQRQPTLRGGAFLLDFCTTNHWQVPPLAYRAYVLIMKMCCSSTPHLSGRDIQKRFARLRRRDTPHVRHPVRSSSLQVGREETISGAGKRGFGARDRQIAEKSCKRWQGRVPCSWPNESFVENETGERGSHASTKKAGQRIGVR